MSNRVKTFPTRLDAQVYINSFVPEIVEPKVTRYNARYAIMIIKNLETKKRGLFKDVSENDEYYSKLHDEEGDLI